MGATTEGCSDAQALVISQQQVPPDDKLIKVGYEVVHTPAGNSSIKGYLAHPA